MELLNLALDANIPTAKQLESHMLDPIREKQLNAGMARSRENVKKLQEFRPGRMVMKWRTDLPAGMWKGTNTDAMNLG